MRWRTRPTDESGSPVLVEDGEPFEFDADGDGQPDMVYPAPRPAPRAARSGSALAVDEDTPGAVLPSWGTPPEGRPSGQGEGSPQDSIEGRVEGSPEDDEWEFEDNLPSTPRGAVLHADVTVRETNVRPVLPAWAMSREGIKNQSVAWLRQEWHRVKFHGLRLLFGVYAGRVLRRFPRGLGRAVNAWRVWAFDTVAVPVVQSIASHKHPDYEKFLKTRDQHSTFARARLIVSLAVAVAVLVLLLVALVLVPVLWLALALVPVLVVLAYVGTDRDTPLVPQAIATYEAPKLTAPVLERAMLALDIKQLTAALAPGGPGLDYPAPIVRDEGGKGWRADIDLPYGVVPADVAERRQKLASGLRRPLGCVWPEGDPEVHEGRLVLRVLDQDFAKQKSPLWPLAKAGRHDYFKPYPFGWDVRGRLIEVSLFELNFLTGAMMGQGKSATLRVAGCAAALDPTVELWVSELLGKGDFEDLEGVCHRYVNGVDDDSIRAAAEGLHELRLEVERRTVQLGKVPTDMKPDKKVTREIANHRSWGLYPIVAIFDEMQNLFTHAMYGKQAAEDAEFIIRSARAVAVTLLLGTQIPDAKSVPPAVTRLAGLRFCLKVMDHTANDMILGTGMHKNGYKANILRSKVDAGIGVLVGATDLPTIVRSAYLDGPAVKKIAQRARDLRERAGTITGHAAGLDPDKVTVTVVNVAQDVRAVFRADETALWNEVIMRRLRELRPGYYDAWPEDQITSALKQAGVDRAGRQVERRDPDTGERRNRRGVHLTDLMDALPAAPEEAANPPSALASTST